MPAGGDVIRRLTHFAKTAASTKPKPMPLGVGWYHYNNPKTPVENAATRNRARSNAKSPEHFNRPGEPLYDPHWVANPGGSEKRQRWIDRLRALGFLDTASTD